MPLAGNTPQQMAGTKSYSYVPPSVDYPYLSQVWEYDDQNSPGDRLLQTDQIYDGLGRLAQSRTMESSAQYIATSQAYDALGRVAWTTNPIRNTDNTSNIAYTHYSYDALGRRTGISYPDGSQSTSAYAGNQVTETDAAGKMKRFSYDALGRLTSVTEDPNGLNYPTSYQHDALGNLLTVIQGTGPQGRSFQYDSLGNLSSAQNPESGTVLYSYDQNGNLTQRSDNRGITTILSYDALNRVTQKSYSDGTPTATYTYGSVGNSRGQLTSVSNGNSTTNYTNFDVMGRVLASNQITQGQTYSFSYGYNLAGALTSETYPSGRTITTSYDPVNRPVTVQGTLEGQSKTYASGVSYWAHGGLNAFTAGNNVVPVYTYNSRLQINNWWATIGNDGSRFLLNIIPDWGSNNNNGNVWSVAEGYGPSVPWSSLGWLHQNYSYDGVNRLSAVSDSGYSRSFCYDAFGNGWVTGNSGVMLTGNTPQQMGSPCPSSSTPYNPINNRIVGANYDAAGNQTVANGNTVAYDAENRQVAVTESPAQGGGTETYAYDGAGQRVSKSGPGGTTVYVYDALGQLAAEYSTAISTPPCTTCYLTWDHLGTPRLITDQNGSIVARHDYLPFGEEIPGEWAGRNGQFGASDGIATEFTGQYRDAETGEDYFNARYFTGALGRFNSPDPGNAGADITNPQSWNAYAYVWNNPLVNTDPTGADTCPNGSYADACVVDTPPPDIPTDPCFLLSCYGRGNGGGSNPNPVLQQQPVPSQPVSIPNGNNYNNCVAGFTGAGAGIGAGIGGFVGGGIGAVGGASAGAAGGTLVAPGVGTIGGGVAGGVAGEAAGSASGALVGGGLGVGAGYVLGNVVCPDRGSKTGGGAGKGSGYRDKTRGANANDGQQIRNVARQAGIDPRRFGDFVEEEKEALGRGPSENFSYGELVQLANDYKAGGGK